MARHRSSALRVAAVVLGSGDDADDVVQVASERMWRSIGTVDVDRGFRSWFLHGVANTARNHRRSRWRRRSAELRLAVRRDGGLSSAADPVDAAVFADQRVAVLRALNGLDRESRLVIALRHFEQLTEREMADVLDCPTGTVKSRLSRAMSALRERLVEVEP